MERTRIDRSSSENADTSSMKEGFHHIPPRWLSGRRSSLLTRETGFKHRVGQINISCHQLATDVALHCVPWRK